MVTGGIAQLVRACVLYTLCPWFESKYPHHKNENKVEDLFLLSLSDAWIKIKGHFRIFFKKLFVFSSTR